MLFSSFEFILIFLPAVFAGFALISRIGLEKAIICLVLSPLVFYGYWNPNYLVLLGASIIFNFVAGKKLSQTNSKSLLTLCVGVNLLVLIYFKYLNFLSDNIIILFDLSVQIPTIILPLAISFFTFQQIAYLVDSYQGKTKEYSFSHYCLFVSFFPQLIAGPIVHHKQMMSQFSSYQGISPQNIYIGLCFFSIGLFKKIVIADSAAPLASYVFM